VLDHLLAELARSMALCAVARLDEIDDGLVAADRHSDMLRARVSP
jgi:hypothetical protein